ncbi:MAG TPA: chemotaxis protein CheE [Brevundimonas sp.]|nr:chemotaxis protein CheE [Brevundimonas sp.]
MSVITHTRAKSRLATMIDSAGGVSVGVALAQARANIEAMRAQAMAVVDAQIILLESVPEPSSLEEQPGRIGEAYRAANGVIDAASPFELLDLCRAAAGLCDILDNAPAGQPFDWRIVTVHARALKLLQNLPLEEADSRAAVLDSLGQVVVRKAAPRPAASAP